MTPRRVGLARRATVVAVALAVGPVLTAVALLVVAHPWAPKAAYALPGFPEPRIALGDDDRSRLAAVGTRAIQPWRPDGIDAMRAARREDGRLAFVSKELAHFEDVRGVVLLFLLAGAAGVMVIAGAAVLVGERSLVGRGLIAGTRLTVAAYVALGALMLVGFDVFFEGFHALFFEADSWRLPKLGTARSLYPDALWAIMGGAIVALVFAQAGAIAAAVRHHRR